MAYPRPSGPRTVWQELKALAPRERHQQVFAVLSLLITVFTFGLFEPAASVPVLPGLKKLE